MSRYYGQVFQLLGAAITTSYQAGGQLGGGNGIAPRRHFSLVGVLLAVGTAITGLTAKVQASVDGANWFDLPSLNDLTAVLAVDQAFTTVINNTIPGQISIADVWPNLRVQIKAAGGAGQAGESFTVLANDAPA